MLLGSNVSVHEICITLFQLNDKRYVAKLNKTSFVFAQLKPLTFPDFKTKVCEVNMKINKGLVREQTFSYI
jgi:hypothetical protein